MVSLITYVGLFHPLDVQKSMPELICTECGSVSLRYPERLEDGGLITCARCNAARFSVGELRDFAHALGLAQSVAAGAARATDLE